MRQIKFRAWDKVDKRMIDDKDVNFVIFQNGEVHSSGSYCEGGTEEWVWGCNWEEENKDLVVMQFTGLKDKNGKEIYEGDIVQRRGGIKPKFKVVFDSKRCGFGYKQEGDFLRFMFDYGQEEMEVIGNIYENPELMA